MKNKQISAFLIALATSGVVLAEERFSSKVVIDGAVEPESSLVTFMQNTRNKVKQHNLSAVKQGVDGKFYFSRDFGGMYNSSFSGQDNFVNIFALDESASSDMGWRLLKELLSAKHFQRVGNDICAPANATPVKSQRPDEFWLSWGYVNGKDVNVRSKPSLQSDIIGTLSYQVIEPIAGEKGDRVKGLNGQGIWVKVQTPEGKLGYLYSAYFSNFQKAQLCYRNTAQGWKISGYVGGGE